MVCEGGQSRPWRLYSQLASVDGVVDQFRFHRVRQDVFEARIRWSEDEVVMVAVEFGSRRPIVEPVRTYSRRPIQRRLPPFGDADFEPPHQFVRVYYRFSVKVGGQPTPMLIHARANRPVQVDNLNDLTDVGAEEEHHAITRTPVLLAAKPGKRLGGERAARTGIARGLGIDRHAQSRRGNH